MENLLSLYYTAKENKWKFEKKKKLTPTNFTCLCLYWFPYSLMEKSHQSEGVIWLDEISIFGINKYRKKNGDKPVALYLDRDINSLEMRSNVTVII